MSSSKRKILFLLSGSIAAFKACQVISRLVQDGCEVQVAATASTFEFVGRMTLEGLTGKKVLSDLWESGHAMDHIHLTRWADMAVLCPASANTLARLAHGMADDLVSAMALAWPMDKKFYIFPAMNLQMLQADVTQSNLRLLQARGFFVAPTQNGALACGEEGPGRLPEPEEILKTIFASELGEILLTAGATREPIDGIRYISNVSTGRTAATLAEDLTNLGWRVTVLQGQGSVPPQRAARSLPFTDFADLDNQLRDQLANHPYRVVIHCAAVSDYSPEGADRQRKLASSEDLTVHLRRNFKILPRLREYARDKAIQVVGFKLTLNADPEQTRAAAQSLLSDSVDMVVANDWSQVDKARTRGGHPGEILTRRGATPFADLHQLSLLLHMFLQGENNDSLS